jgi:hypothetical protein
MFERFARFCEGLNSILDARTDDIICCVETLRCDNEFLEEMG